MYRDSYKVDILFLIEHRDRELDVVCEIAKELKSKYGLSVAIGSLLFHTLVAAIYIRPKVIVLPFGWKSSDFPLSLFRSLYGDKIIYVNMNLEQVLSPVNQAYKKPRDLFVKSVLKHFSWSENFKKYLIDNGVSEKNIYLTGKPAVSLLTDMASHGESIKRYLAENFKLPFDCRWIFFPMNCGWAFISDRQIKNRIRNGYDEKNALAYKEYLSRTINIIFKWIAEMKDEIRDKKIIFILRPHPSVSVQQYKKRLNEIIGYLPDHIYVHKDLTLKEWLVASDTCYTNFSTAALDAQIIKKPTYLMEPEPYPQFLKMDWYNDFSQIKSFDEFRKSFKGGLSIKQNNFLLTDYAMVDLNGISESAKHLAKFAKEKNFSEVSFVNLLRGILSNPRQTLGSVLRLLIVPSGLNLFNILPSGIKIDFFDRNDVVKILNRYR